MHIVQANDMISALPKIPANMTSPLTASVLIQVPASPSTFSSPPQTHHQTHTHLTIMPASEPEAAPRFKRRKTTHTKRVRLDDSSALAPGDFSKEETACRSDAPLPKQGEEGDVPNLKEILGRRRRVGDYRGREVGVRRGGGDQEVVKDGEGEGEGEKMGGREGRFVKQTGQVVDLGDREM